MFILSKRLCRVFQYNDLYTLLWRLQAGKRGVRQKNHLFRELYRVFVRDDLHNVRRGLQPDRRQMRRGNRRAMSVRFVDVF